MRGARMCVCRCTVGHFNWVPELLDIVTPSSPETVTSEMHTALHEMVHVLGGMLPGTAENATMFLDEHGRMPDPRNRVYVVQSDTAYGKFVTKIITPKVLNVSRQYFGCDTMDGFPLEDIPLGKAAHWEARLAGPELMSYGSNSGQVYVSDLTFAFLEDTNQVSCPRLCALVLGREVDWLTYPCLVSCSTLQITAWVAN